MQQSQQEPAPEGCVYFDKVQCGMYPVKKRKCEGRAVTTLAEQECRRLGWAFSESFRNQYTITDRTQDTPEGWASQTLDNWRVSHCQNLPRTELTFSNGLVVGIVLGYAISPEGMMLEGRHKLPISSRSAASLAQAERYISQLAGRYVVLLSIGTSARVYSDAVCSLGPVYDPVTRRLGASVALALDRPLIDNPEVGIDSVAAGEACYLFGQTPDRDAKRALANHYIDLSDFSQRRHWPTDDMDFTLGGRRRQDVSHEIAAKLRLNMKALIERYPTALPVTGGKDSRLLVAAASDMLDQISQFFVYHTNATSAADSEIALEIAREMSFPLRVISRETQRFRSGFSDADHADHMSLRHLRGGFEPETADPDHIRATQMVPDRYLILRGNMTGMARARHWRRPVFKDPHNTEFALTSLGVPASASNLFCERTQSAFVHWKENLPEKALPRIYDFLQMDVLQPHTNSAAYARESDHMFINPFNDRHLLHLTASIPPFMRKNGRIVEDIVSAYAKEISGFDDTSERLLKWQEQGAAISQRHKIG